VWGRRRLHRLEEEIAEAKADSAALRDRLDLFESIAAAAGAAVGPVPEAPMPPELVAAAREVHSQDIPVRLNVSGTEVIAIIGGPGDPREWWTAIWQLGQRAQETS
jgi:hypothetical protein